MNTYPFAGEIKMEKVIKDGKEVIEWEPVPLQSDRFSVDPVTGNVGIGTPSQEPIEYTFTSPATEWARVDKDMNVTHLDMELCAKGPHNAYTALAMAIWNKAIETEREKVAAWMMRQGYATGHGDTVEDLLKELEWQIRESEREACAKVVEAIDRNGAWVTKEEAAGAIRARGNT
jgi:hypothetical protein